MILPDWFSFQNGHLYAGFILISLSLGPDFEVEELPLNPVKVIGSVLATLDQLLQLVCVYAHNFFAHIVEGGNPSLACVVSDSE